MDRRQITIERTGLRTRNDLAQMHGYEAKERTGQLSGRITSSSEYPSWQDFFQDLREDFDKFNDDKRIQLLWVPQFHSISGAARKFEEYSCDPGELMSYLLEPAETYGDVVVQYGRAMQHDWPFLAFHDRLTFRMDDKGVVYCVRGRVVSRNLDHYTSHGFKGNGFSGDENRQIFAYFHERR